MKAALLFLVMFVSGNCFGQSYLKPNEEVIISFQTKNRKLVYLVKDKADKYITYRFGTKDKIEFEYPTDKENSWPKFTYSWYLRGGGIANEGMDLNYVSFTNGDYRYVIYQNYFSVEDNLLVGVKVTDLKTDKTVDIKGDSETRKGALTTLRDNDLIMKGEELFD